MRITLLVQAFPSQEVLNTATCSSLAASGQRVLQPDQVWRQSALSLLSLQSNASFQLLQGVGEGILEKKEASLLPSVCRSCVAISGPGQRSMGLKLDLAEEDSCSI